MNAYDIGWIVWGLYFLVVEGTALARRDKGGTLSEHVWDLFGVGQREEAPSISLRFRRIALLSFMAWLTVHFLTGGNFV
jgi:hypothetical protein